MWFDTSFNGDKSEPLLSELLWKNGQSDGLVHFLPKLHGFILYRLGWYSISFHPWHLLQLSILLQPPSSYDRIKFEDFQFGQWTGW